MLMLLKIKYN